MGFKKGTTSSKSRTSRRLEETKKELKQRESLLEKTNKKLNALETETKKVLDKQKEKSKKELTNAEVWFVAAASAKNTAEKSLQTVENLLVSERTEKEGYKTRVLNLESQIELSNNAIEVAEFKALRAVSEKARLETQMGAIQAKAEKALQTSAVLSEEKTKLTEELSALQVAVELQKQEQKQEQTTKTIEVVSEEKESLFSRLKSKIGFGSTNKMKKALAAEPDDPTAPAPEEAK
jgi:chromosome segregation ATPase